MDENTVESSSIRVEIYDESYHLRGSDTAYIQHLAEVVDAKMRAIFAAGCRAGRPQYRR